MTPKEEKIYVEGRRAVYREQLWSAIRGLHGSGEGDLTVARLAAERADLVSTLRIMCRDHGDNDWDDDLNLSDVIEKHLVRGFRP